MSGKHSPCTHSHLFSYQLRLVCTFSDPLESLWCKTDKFQLPLSVLVLQFLPLHFCTANASSSSLLWLRGLGTACYMSGKRTLSVFTVFLQLHLFPLLAHQTEFSKVCEHTAKVGEGPLLRSNTVLVMITNEWVSACRADRQKPFNWPIGPPSKCSVQPRRVKQGMWIIKH